jgi:hypothetical protein
MKPEAIRKTIHERAFPIKVTQHDIDVGDCRDANSCMIRVAIERELRKLEPEISNHYTRVANGFARFVFGTDEKTGLRRRWKGPLPIKAIRNLIEFDREDGARRKAAKAGLPFASRVEPFAFTLHAARGPLTERWTDQRREQIRAARAKRKAEGREPRRKYTLRQRIVGFA